MLTAMCRIWGLRHGLLRKCRACDSFGVANSEGEWYAVDLTVGPDDIAKMCKMSTLGGILLEAPVPTSNTAWLESVTMVETRTSGLRLDFWWLVCAHLLMEMRHKGIECLTVCTDRARRSEIIKERNKVKREERHCDEGNPAVIAQTVMRRTSALAEAGSHTSGLG